MAQNPPGPVRYHVEDLGGLPGSESSTAAGINDAGDVVGWTSTGLTDGGNRAFIYKNGGWMVELQPLPGFIGCVARDINNAGQAVGYCGQGMFDKPKHAVRWAADGTPEDLGVFPGGTHSEAYDINDDGDVVGVSEGAIMETPFTHAFLYTDEGGMVDLTPGTTTSSAAHGINNRAEGAQVVGYKNNVAFLWSGGTLKSLGKPANHAYSFGYGVNDSGAVVGSAKVLQREEEAAARFQPGAGWQVLSGLGARNVLRAVNNSGVAVGAAGDYSSFALVHRSGAGVQDLNTLIDAGETWSMNGAFDINEAGQIVGIAQHIPSGTFHAVRLTPFSGAGPFVSVSDVPVIEPNTGEAAASFTVKLSHPSTETVTVRYGTAGRTATAPADFVAVPGTTLTFAPGETSKTIKVMVKGDLIDEEDETFRLLLASPTGAVIADNEGVCTIVDNDAQPAARVSSTTVAETNAATNASFTVSLSRPSGLKVTVNYQTANGTAVAPSDYAAHPVTTLTFLPGETTKTVQVTVAGDTRDEAAETFRLVLSAPANATIATGAGTCTITDNDPAPSITITDVQSLEPDSGTANAVFTVRLSAPSGQKVTVNYATGGGTAAAGSDYNAVAQTAITFLPGQTTKLVPVQVRGDLSKEANETFFVSLSGAVNATIADAQGQGTILNDD
ncbi:MAG TPA: Calx-beta domain-containing protein [Pyrinomonadaceae bacterium]|nr:Calx-beta domain-containing protein [Pyrinomonadaceae bacterium]